MTEDRKTVTLRKRDGSSMDGKMWQRSVPASEAARLIAAGWEPDEPPGSVTEDREPGTSGWGDHDDSALAARMNREADLLESETGRPRGGWCADIFTSSLLRAGAERLTGRPQ